MPEINFNGQPVNALSLKFKSIKEDWNEYELEDGSNVRMKAVVSDIIKVPDQFDPEGNPIYMVKATNVLSVKSPDNLKRKK